MAPPPKAPREVTFLGWLEDFFKLPLEVPRQTIAVIRDQSRDQILYLRFTVRPPGPGSSTDIQMAIAQGVEEVRDLPGVTNVYTLKDLGTNPVETVRKTLKKTLDDIMNLDEVNAAHREIIMGNLTKGRPVDDDGTPLLSSKEPALRVLFRGENPLIETIGGIARSKIQLVIDTSATSEAVYKDRRDVQTGDSTPIELQSYTNMANTLTLLAGTMEVRDLRIANRNSTIQQFNRSIARELGSDIKETFSYKLKEIGQTKAGKLNNFLAGGFDVNTLVVNPAAIADILGMTQADYLALQPATQKFLQEYLKAEVAGIKITGDPYLGKTIGAAVSAHPRFGFDPNTGAFPPTMSAPLQKAWSEFAKDGLKSEDRVKNYTKLRNAYLKEGRLGEWVQVTMMDLGLDVEGERYGGIKPKALYHDDLQFTYQQHLLEAEAVYEAFRSEINSDIANYAASVGLDPAELNSRLDSLRLAKNISHDLFWSSTTKEILESLESGKFINNVIVLSRFWGTLPFASKKLRAANGPLTTYADPRTYLLQPAEAVIAMTGLAFEGKKSGALGKLGLAFENRHIIYYQHQDPTGPGGKLQPAGKWSIVTLKHSQAVGLFDKDGKNGIYDVLSHIESFGDDMGVINPDLVNPQSYFTDPTKLTGLKDAVQSAQAGGAYFTPANQFEIIAKEIGFADPGKKAVAESFIKNVDRALAPDGAISNINALKLRPGEQWKFLQRVVKSGKGSSLGNKIVRNTGTNLLEYEAGGYIGVLNLYNRYANMARDFLFKPVLWGSYGNWIPGIGWARNYLRNLGFDEEAGLATWLRNRAPFKAITSIGENLSELARKPGNAAALAALRASRLARPIAGVAGWLSKGAAGQAILKSVGYVVQGAAGIFSGGVAWVFAAFGSTLWKLGKGLLTGNISKGLSEAKEDLGAKWGVLKKIILYPLACACGCIAVPIILIVIIIGSILAPLEIMGGGSFSQAQSTLLTVTKEAAEDRGAGTITYLVTITNNSNQEVAIATFTDNLTYTAGCSAPGSGQILALGAPGFPGSATIPADVIGTVIPIGQSVTREFTLTGINTSDDGSYINNVLLTAQGEAGRTASASVSTTIGAGGCFTCPAGWPFSTATPQRVVQGPAGRFSHNALEAIDTAPDGTYNPAVNPITITATHSGVVYAATEECSGVDTEGDRTDGLCGYGHFVDVESVVNNQTFRTRYAHFDSFLIASGTPVQRGTPLGIMGTTGYSTGFHLHYEFRNPTVQCIPGSPMRMVNVQADSYIPKTVLSGCYYRNQFDNYPCNMSIP